MNDRTAVASLDGHVQCSSHLLPKCQVNTSSDEPQYVAWTAKCTSIQSHPFYKC